MSLKKEIEDLKKELNLKDAKIKTLHTKLQMIEQIYLESKDLEHFRETCALNEIF